MSDRVYIGALSGTSMDAFDIAAVRFATHPTERDSFELLACARRAFPEALHDELLQLQLQINEAESYAQAMTPAAAVNQALGRHFAETITQLIKTELGDEPVAAIGLHGQTLLHRPTASPPFTVQIGDPHVVATHTGCVTVADFRQSDLTVGGQGAPLAPLFHHALFSQPGECRGVVNIGGIANITLLEKDGAYGGYDCGPGNILLDAWTRRHLNRAYDCDGAWARSGTCNRELLAQLLDDEFIRQAPPKSACATDFNITWLEKKIAAATPLKAEDVQASLLQLSVRCIADALSTASPQRVFVCGGGAHNLFLMEQLQARLDVALSDTQALGLAPDWVEAVGFAYLAYQRLEGKVSDLRQVTGARQAVMLGRLYEP